MIKKISFSDFVDEFSEERKDQFSHEGKKALFEYLNDKSTGESVELDIIALCCEYTEYKNIGDYLAEYDTNQTLKDFNGDVDDFNEAIFEEIGNKTQFIEIKDYKGDKLDNFIILNFTILK